MERMKAERPAREIAYQNIENSCWGNENTRTILSLALDEDTYATVESGFHAGWTHILNKSFDNDLFVVTRLDNPNPDFSVVNEV